MTGHMPSVFLSHNHKDKPAVRQVARRLMEHGIKVWIDEAEMNVGDNIFEKLSIVTKEVDYLIVFISKNSIGSNWVKAELEMAMRDEWDNNSLKVLEIRLDDTPLPDTMRYLKTKMYCNLSTPAIYEQEFNRLLRTLGISVGLAPSLDNLLQFDFLDMVVQEKEIFLLAKLLTGTGHFKQDPDGSKKFECHTYLIRIGKDGSIESSPFSKDLCIGHGGLFVNKTHIYCFINYKTQDGTYAMWGSLHVISRLTLHIQYVKEVFRNQNWGWYPIIQNKDSVLHFSFDGYHRCLNEIKGDKIMPNEFDALQIMHIMKHSKGWFPDSKEKIIQKIIGFIKKSI
jgi:TIR domain